MRVFRDKHERNSKQLERQGEKVQVIRDTNNTQLEVIGDMGGLQAIGDATNTMLNGLRRGGSSMRSY